MRERYYQIVGRRAQMVEFPDGDDKVLPPRSIFKALPTNRSVMRLLRQRPPVARELPEDQLPLELSPKAVEEDPIVLIDADSEGRDG